MLLTRDEGRHYLGLRGVNVHADCGGVVVNSFKQALHISVATTQGHDVTGIGEVGHMGVGSNLNPWVIM